MKYKLISNIKRIPLGNQFIRRTHRPYLSINEFNLLLDGEVIVEEKIDGTPVTLEYDDLILFCEDIHYKHTVFYNKIPPTFGKWPAFLVCYDILDKRNDLWLDRIQKENVCFKAGIPIIPLIYRGILKSEDITKLADFISFFGTEPSEGIVIKNYNKKIFGKFITNEFIGNIENKAHWTKKKKIPNLLDLKKK